MPPSPVSSVRDAQSARQDPFWWAWGGLFFAVGLLLFFPALTSYFSSDDFLHLGTIMEGGLPFSPTGNGRGFLRPLVGWSLWLDYRLWGLHAFGYHLTNVSLHVVNSLLVAYLYHLLMPVSREGRAQSIVAGLIFLVLSCHAEPVSWVSGRTDLLATLFSLLCLAASVNGMRGGCRLSLFAAIIFLGLALFSKESALSVPVLVVLTAFYLRNRGDWNLRPMDLFAALIGGALVVLLYFIVRHNALGAFVGGYGVRGHLRFHQDLLAQAMSRYGWRVFLPPLPRSAAPLLADHGRLLADLFTLVFVIHGTAWGFWAWRSPARRTGFFLYVAFWAALLPVINLRIQWTDGEGARFLYLASVYAAFGVAWALGGISRPQWRNGLLAGILVFQSYFLWTSCRGWNYASECARTIVTGLQADAGEGTIVLVNKPDSYDGALLFRTGLSEALRYFGDGPIPDVPVEVLFASTLYNTDHQFVIESMDDGRFVLRATDTTSVFVEEDGHNRIDVLSTDQRTCTFRFFEPPIGKRIFYYTSDGVYRYDSGMENSQQ